LFRRAVKICWTIIAVSIVLADHRWKMQMFEQGLSLSQLYTFFHWLHGAVRDHLFQIVGTLAWAKALTAIGAAYMKRMIPLRTMAMLGNVFGLAVGVGTGSLAAFIEHAVNLPLNATRLREMRRLIASVRGANSTELNIEWLKLLCIRAR
jgi:hypothetical protein